MKYLIPFLLVGCANAPPSQASIPYCIIPIIRPAGLGTQVPGCIAWSIGRIK